MPGGQEAASESPYGDLLVPPDLGAKDAPGAAQRSDERGYYREVALRVDVQAFYIAHLEHYWSRTDAIMMLLQRIPLEDVDARILFEQRREILCLHQNVRIMIHGLNGLTPKTSLTPAHAEKGITERVLAKELRNGIRDGVCRHHRVRRVSLKKEVGFQLCRRVQ